MNRLSISLLLGVFIAGNLTAASVKSEFVIYKDGGKTFEGFMAFPADVKSKKPAVLIVHDWLGISDFTREKAKKMAEMGYVAFAVDMYGKGVHPSGGEEAGKLAGDLKSKPDVLRSRIKAAMKVLTSRPDVEKEKLVAFGYCFGGTTALELARSGASLVGTVSFHGGLKTANPEDAKQIKGRILALHGAIDPHVPMAEVEAFEKEMNDAKVDWELVKYSGAVHAFAVPSAGNDIKTGAAYNEVADHRSWIAFMEFLNEVAPVQTTVSPVRRGR